METVLASRNSTERKGEPEIDFVGPVYSNRTGIIARGRDTVLPVNDTSPKLRPADAGKPGSKARKLVEAGLAGASVLLVSRKKAFDAAVRMGAAALVVGKVAATPAPVCAACERDYTANGSPCCDTAWTTYSLNCKTLQDSYGWDCAGCSCPGDPSPPQSPPSPPQLQCAQPFCGKKKKGRLLNCGKALCADCPAC